MELLSFLLEREAIIGLGIFGAFAVVAGNFLLRPKSSFPKQYARYVMIFGYGLTWISVAFFIIAGFATAYAKSLQ
tara:strand:- start:668 stop:892 length:225 start_codon:yes stop_codon:yes gene_type:complete